MVSFPSCLPGLEGSSPTCACFRSVNFFRTYSCFFFLQNSKEVGGEAEEKMHGV